MFHPLQGKGLHKNKEGNLEYKSVIINSFNTKTELFEGNWKTGEVPCTLPRLFICFDSEDPRKYVLRLANAFQQRKYADSIIRYNYYVDNMPFQDLSELDTEQKKRIETLAKTKKLEEMETTNLILEVSNDFARTMNKIIFDTFLEEQAPTLQQLQAEN